MWGIRFGGPADRREQIGRRMEMGAVASAILLAGGPIAVFLFWWWRHPPGKAARLDPTNLPWTGVTLLSVALVSLRVVGRWFRRLGPNSDIEELRKAAFAYRLGGPLVAQGGVLGGEPLAPEVLQALVDHQAGALLCLAFAFLGALLWSITYLSRRMALRDVTGHAYQTIALRLLGAAIVALFVYHTKVLLVPGDLDNAQRWDEVLVLLVAFAAGVVPEVALRWMMAQTRRLFGAGAEQRADELELETIEGIDA